ncbi:MAG: UbiA family prenyltransferase [Candidatus Gracilibacteria bacterium]|nr:UbiA family prenyltransferase [Candidatus Gracilibacteria bacterium]
MKGFFEKLFSKIENDDGNIFGYVFSLFFVITLRNIIEFYITKSYFGLDFYALFHTYSFFYAIIFTLIFVIFIFVRGRLLDVFKTVTFFSLIITTPPIFDYLINFGVGSNMTYILDKNAVYHNFITFFGGLNNTGVSYGMKLEIIFAIISSFSYGYFYKKISFLRSIFLSFSIYLVFFIFAIYPVFIQEILQFFGMYYNSGNIFLVQNFVIILFVFQILFFYFSDKRFFSTLLKDSRLSRQLHFILFMVIGFFIGLYSKDTNMLNLKILHDSSYLFGLLTSVISLVYGIYFSIVSNNFIDIDIDMISNKDRPLVLDSKLDKRKYLLFGIISLLLSFIYGSAAGNNTLFLIILFIGNYFIYSMPPFRLKRVPFFSKMTISFNTFVTCLIGFSITNPDLKSFPIILAIFIIIGFLFVIQFIDIKDYEGDKKNGINTISVILGLELSKKIIGWFFIGLYLLAGIFLKDIIMLVLCLAFGFINYYLINKPVYREGVIFTNYQISLVLLLAYLIYFPMKIGYFY